MGFKSQKERWEHNGNSYYCRECAEFQIPEGTLGTSSRDGSLLEIVSGFKSQKERWERARGIRSVLFLDELFQIPEGTLGTPTYVESVFIDAVFQIPEGTLGTGGLLRRVAC